MSLYRCKRCGTISYRRGVRLLSCPACGRPLSLPSMQEAEVRSQLYGPPRYVERIEQRPADAEDREDAERREPTR